MNMELDWENHQHALTLTIKTVDHYNDYEINHCILCDAAAAASKVPTKEHWKHPKGCRCYWCEWCRCPEVEKRDKRT